MQGYCSIDLFSYDNDRGIGEPRSMVGWLLFLPLNNFFLNFTIGHLRKTEQPYILNIINLYVNFDSDIDEKWTLRLELLKE